jgi:hypothetical protein
VLGLSAKLDSRVLDLAVMSDLKIIFIILIIIPIVIFIIQIIIFLIIIIIIIIIINLSYSSLSESGCNAVPKNLGCGFGYKIVS